MSIYCLKGPSLQRGSGLLEVSISVLVISVGVVGLLTLQVAAKRAGFEALQRTMASALASDIIERMRGNPGALSEYHGAIAGKMSNVTDSSGQNCALGCTQGQLADRDLWEWEQAIIGAAEIDPNDVPIGGLVGASGCIEVVDGLLEVTISWEGYEEFGIVAATNNCGEHHASTARQLLVVETFIAGGA